MLLRLLIGKALGIGTGRVQRVLMEQPRPFDVGVADSGVCLSVKRRRPPVRKQTSHSPAGMSAKDHIAT